MCPLNLKKGNSVMANTAILFVVPGARLPQIPAEYRSFIFLEKIEMEVDDPALSQCDKYLLSGASAGFSPKGTIRLKIPKQKDPTTWINKSNVNLVYGIKNGKPWVDINYHFCRNCREITAYSLKIKLRPFKPREPFIFLHCPKCGATWRIPKKQSHKTCIDIATIRRSTKPRIRTKRF